MPDCYCSVCDFHIFLYNNHKLKEGCGYSKIEKRDRHPAGENRFPGQRCRAGKESVSMEKLKEREWILYNGRRLLGALAGAVIYSLGVNLFIVPVGLYSGGVMGFAQLIRTITSDYLHLALPFDIAGIIYYMINVPVLLLAMKKIGKQFFFKTITCVTTVTILLSVIPIPQTPILMEDTLASCLIGGIICGCGMGIALKMGGSLGGMDIVGVLLIKWKRDFSVGKVNLIMNIILYGICLFLFNVATVIYSLIYAAVSSFAVDKVHAQIINVEVRIVTSKDSHEMEKEIMTELGRGITKINSMGVYTNHPNHMLYVLVSKYEVSHLKQIVHKNDPHAFVVINEGVHIVGNYVKKL